MTVTQEITTTHYKTLTGLLGKKYIRSGISTPLDFIAIANGGVSAQVILNFRKYFDISLDETASWLNISIPTIYRWIREDKKLGRNHAIQLFELADLFLYGTGVFDSKENFFKWLSLPNTALGGMEPKDLLEIPGGTFRVKDILGRIEYGVYS
jgi:putative toxin-antitoxin system antitoxin component (TIGR02293 family)